MARSTPKIETDNYVGQAIVRLLSLKLKTGTSTEELRLFIEKCMKEATRASKNSVQTRGLDIHRLGSVLRTWHKEGKYLTFDGLPRPLKTEGRLGLRGLIRKYYPTEKFDTVIGRLLETKLIQQNGRKEWIPSGRTATIPQVSPETLEHLAEGVARYVETVTRNITAKREQDVLFERSCKVTKLPIAQCGAFREYVGQQALSFLTVVDDWLENRVSRLGKSNTRTCTAGVYTFAYIATRDMKRRPGTKLKSR